MKERDFSLDLVSVSKSKNSSASTKITSVSLCTPGCITGALMGCKSKTASCNCSVHIHVSR